MRIGTGATCSCCTTRHASSRHRRDAPSYPDRICCRSRPRTGEVSGCSILQRAACRCAAAFFTARIDNERNLLLGMLGHDMRGPLQVIHLTAASSPPPIGSDQTMRLPDFPWPLRGLGNFKTPWMDGLAGQGRRRTSNPSTRSSCGGRRGRSSRLLPKGRLLRFPAPIADGEDRLVWVVKTGSTGDPSAGGQNPPLQSVEMPAPKRSCSAGRRRSTPGPAHPLASERARSLMGRDVTRPSFGRQGRKIEANRHRGAARRRRQRWTVTGGRGGHGI